MEENKTPLKMDIASTILTPPEPVDAAGIQPAPSAAAPAQGGQDFPDLHLDAEQTEKAKALAAKIDVTDSALVSQYGVEVQSGIASFSDTILEKVRAKDAGYAGSLLTNLIVTVKNVDIDSLDGKKDGLFGKLFGVKKSVEKFMAGFDKTSVQIDKITDQLDKERMTMLKDIEMYDLLYKKNLEYLKQLDIVVAAGRMKLQELTQTVIPAAQAKAQQTGDPMDAQASNDLAQAAARFEKKLHDMLLSRMSAIQTCPQIKLIQQGDQVLAEKIQTSILQTIPLWKNQVVIAIGMNRQQAALQMERAVTDTTNQLLLKNSAMLKQNTTEIARENERGVIDIDTLRQVNADLISTIEDTIRIQDEGHAKRQQAETELATLEKTLKERLIALKK